MKAVKVAGAIACLLVALFAAYTVVVETPRVFRYFPRDFEVSYYLINLLILLVLVALIPACTFAATHLLKSVRRKR